METTDPLPDLINEILSMEGTHADTALLIRMAVEAQQTGILPALPPTTPEAHGND